MLRCVPQGLVWSSWAVIALVVIVVVATFNMFPEFNDPKYARSSHESYGV